MLHYEPRDARYAPNAFPLSLRLASLALSSVVVGVILIQAATAAAAIVA